MCGVTISWKCPLPANCKWEEWCNITSPKHICWLPWQRYSQITPHLSFYNGTFLITKEQDEKVRINITSEGTDISNKPFRLRNLRRSILEAKFHDTTPDGIHDILLKRFPENTRKISTEILNNFWTFLDFSVESSSCDLLRQNKDCIDPSSNISISLTCYLYRVRACMINTCFICCLEISSILDRSQCGFRKHHSTVGWTGICLLDNLAISQVVLFYPNHFCKQTRQSRDCSR